MKMPRTIDIDKREHEVPNADYIDLLCAAVYEVITPEEDEEAA